MFNQQGFQGGQSSFAQGNRYQPSGFAPTQSFAGQFGGGFQNQNQSSQPVISHIGSQVGAPSGSFNPGYNTQASSGDRANFGPVISHVGYEAGRDFNGGQGPQTQFGGSYGPTPVQSFTSQGGSFAGQSSFGAGQASFRGGFAGQTSTQQNQPVISRLGYQSGGQGRPVIQALGGSSVNSSYPGGFQQSGFGGQSQGGFAGGFAQGGQVNAQTPENPVYRATQGYRNDGPVIQHLGYQASNDASQSQGFSGAGFNAGFQSGFQGGFQGR